MIETQRERERIKQQDFRILRILQFVSKYLIIYKIMDSFFHNKKCLLDWLMIIRNKLKLELIWNDLL